MVGRGSNRALMGLVTHVYDAALDSALWPGTAARIAEALGSSSAVVKLHGAEAQVRLLECTPNLTAPDPAWAEAWHSRDLWVHRSVGVGLSEIVTSDQLVAPEEIGRSAFYQEWLPTLDIHHMIGAVFSAEGGMIGVLGVHRPSDAARYDAADRRAVGAFLPHLARALRVGQRLDKATHAAALVLENLDRLDAGVVIADATGAVHHLNAVAEAMLVRRDGLEVRFGRLHARTPRLQSDLMAILTDAVGLASGRTLATPAPLRLEREGRAAWSLAAAPLRSRWSGLHRSEPMAMIFLRDPEFPAIRIEQLRALFGLTRTEALVASELARGRALDQIARSLGLGLGTVRTHLKQVLAKTGAARQAEAVALIVRSVAALPLA